MLYGCCALPKIALHLSSNPFHLLATRTGVQKPPFQAFRLPNSKNFAAICCLGVEIVVRLEQDGSISLLMCRIRVCGELNHQYLETTCHGSAESESHIANTQQTLGDVKRAKERIWIRIY